MARDFGHLVGGHGCVHRVPSAAGETSNFDAAEVETGPSRAAPADDALAPPSPTDSAARLAPDLSYDRQADLQARAAEARRQLGAQTVVRVEGDVFVLAAPRASPKFDQAADLARQALDAFYRGGRFAKLPDRAVTAFIFGRAGPFRRALRIAGRRRA